MFSGLKNITRKLFISGFSEEFLSNPDNGGEKCYNYMTFEFKLTITILAVPIYLIIFFRLIKNLSSKLDNEKRKVTLPGYLEIITGIMSIIAFISQIYYKFNSKAMIYMFNPCHIFNLIQGCILLSKNTKLAQITYILLINGIFCPWIALLFPLTNGLDAPWELEFFWIEHLLAAIISPIVLSISGRYYSKNIVNFKNNLLLHCIFALYQRVILFPMSMISWVNLNFALCPGSTDPFAQIVGKNYYFLSDIYLLFSGVLCANIGDFKIKFLNKLLKI